MKYKKLANWMNKFGIEFLDRFKIEGCEMIFFISPSMEGPELRFHKTRHRVNEELINKVIKSEEIEKVLERKKIKKQKNAKDFVSICGNIINKKEITIIIPDINKNEEKGSIIILKNNTELKIWKKTWEIEHLF